MKSKQMNKAAKIAHHINMLVEAVCACEATGWQEAALVEKATEACGSVAKLYKEGSPTYIGWLAVAVEFMEQLQFISELEPVTAAVEQDERAK